MTWRIGVDIGGTFADFAALDEASGTLATLKVLTTPAEPGRDVADGLARLATQGVDLASVARFVHGTTVGVNTLLQRRGAVLALFTTAGFTDMLELARLRMPETYGLFCTRAEPLVPRERVFPILERMDAAGRTLRAPDRPSVEAAVAGARAAGVDGIVVSFLHAWRNPAHEEVVAALLAEIAPELFVFRGSEVWPAIREYERTTTAVMNAYVHPRVAGYLEQVEGRIAAAGVPAPLLLTTLAGGTMTAGQGRRDCVGMLLSGTASGVVGAAVVARATGARDVLTLDVGGTSADIALAMRGRQLGRPRPGIAVVRQQPQLDVRGAVRCRWHLEGHRPDAGGLALLAPQRQEHHALDPAALPRLDREAEHQTLGGRIAERQRELPRLLDVPAQSSRRRLLSCGRGAPARP
jgi:N-methylhydantoinase A